MAPTAPVFVAVDVSYEAGVFMLKTRARCKRCAWKGSTWRHMLGLFSPDQANAHSAGNAIIEKRARGTEAGRRASRDALAHATRFHAFRPL